MLVFVKNKHGENLMPCKLSKARKLLKQNKAKIVNSKSNSLERKSVVYTKLQQGKVEKNLIKHKRETVKTLNTRMATILMIK